MTEAASKKEDRPAPLETERLWLRPMTIHHAEFYLQLMNSPGWYRFIGDRNVRTLQECEEYLGRSMLPQWEEKGFGNYIAYRKEDGAPIGAIGIFTRPGLENVDLGFALLDEYMGQGYGYEGAKRLLEEAANSFELTMIGAITSPENIPCQGLLTKLGFVYLRNIVLPNQTNETRFYELKLTPNSPSV
jgi:RimJ/RimL family protein N-acetyltransferase